MSSFSLAGLLRLRRLKENQAAATLAAHRSRASELAAERHQLVEQMTDHGHEAREVQDIAALSAARASTSAMLAELDAMRQSQLAVITEAERVHQAARREVRTVEKLEERHDERSRIAELAAEQRTLDELAGRTAGAPRDASDDAHEDGGAR